MGLIASGRILEAVDVEIATAIENPPYLQRAREADPLLAAAQSFTKLAVGHAPGAMEEIEIAPSAGDGPSSRHSRKTDRLSGFVNRPRLG